MSTLFVHKKAPEENLGSFATRSRVQTLACLPEIVVGAFVNDRKSGRLFGAQSFVGMTLEDAVAKAETFENLY